MWTVILIVVVIVQQIDLFLIRRRMNNLMHELNGAHETYHRHYVSIWRETFKFVDRIATAVDVNFNNLDSYMRGDAGNPNCRIDTDSMKSDELKDIEDKYLDK